MPTNKPVGSNPDSAKTFKNNPKDFGIPVTQADHPIEPVEGAPQTRSPDSVIQSDRVHGVGAPDRGKPGSGSGGDVDTDIIGIADDGATVSTPDPNNPDTPPQ